MQEVHSCKGALHNSVVGACRTGRKETRKRSEERNAFKGHYAELTLATSIIKSRQSVFSMGLKTFKCLLFLKDVYFQS